MNLGVYRLKNPLPEMIPQAAPGAAPASAFTPTPGVLDSVPQLYPGGPSDVGFLYAQLQKVPFLGTVQTFTLNQTIHVTSPGETLGALKLHITDTVDGTGDPTAIRPAALILQHDSTLTPVGGIGTGTFFQTLDANGTTVRIGKELCEITDATPGACISTLGWCVQKSGVEVEVFRLRGAAGMAPTFFAGGSMATGGGSTGQVGGQLWVRGDLLTTGDSVHQKTDAVTNAPLRMKTYEHLLSAGTVAAGFGTEHYWQSRDGSNNLVGIGRQQVFITTPTTGSVDSSMAWGVIHSGVEVEVARVRGVGMAPTSGSTFVGGSGGTGFVGGQLFIRGDLLHAGTSLGFYNATPAAKPTVSGSRGANAALASLLSALATLGLVTDSSS